MADLIDDFSTMSRGAAASDALALIKEKVEKEQERLSRMAFAHIELGDLDPQKSQLLWVRKFELHKLQESLLREVVQGRAAASRVKKETE